MELTLKNISSGYDTLIIKNQSLNIRRGSWNFIIGETGSGKSTLLQSIGCLIDIKDGDIYWRNKNIKILKNLKEFRKNTRIMFQYTEKQFFNNTVKEEIIYSLLRRKIPKNEIEQVLKEVLSLLNLSENILDKSPYELSGGQKRFVALASILIEKPTLLLLDEPTCGLDIQNQNIFFKILKDLKESGVTIIQISHILEDVLEYGDNVIKMSKGEIIEIGFPKEVLNNMNVETLDILKILSDFGLNTENINTVDDLLVTLRGDQFVK